MDLLTGEEIVLTKGSLRRAIAASSAIPGMFPVIEINGRALVDGGWADNIPVAPAIALGAHFVLASDATLEVNGMATQPRSAMEILFRCNEITRIHLNRHRQSAADVLIVPEIGDIFWADFKSLDHCLAAGRKAFEQNESTILRRMLVRRFQTLGGTVHPGRVREWRHQFLII
jgi:NTE family protein